MEEEKVISFHLQKLNSSQSDEQTASLIHAALNSESLFVFSELLENEKVLKLKDSAEHQKLYKLLELFAYNSYSDYLAQKQSIGIEISEEQTIKLRKLSIISLCSEHKEISYEVLSKELDLPNIRELEDLIIECIYQDIIKAKLDHKNKKILVEFAIGRDLRDSDIDSIVSILSAWKAKSDLLLASTKQSVTFIEEQSKKSTQHNQDIQAQIRKLTEEAEVMDPIANEQMLSDLAFNTGGGKQKRRKFEHS